MEHLLFEHTGGYELFELRSFEGLSSAAFADPAALSQIANHISTLPFPDVDSTLEAMAEEEELHEKLRNFLAINGVSVLHADASLGRALEAANIQHKLSPNIMRGVRQNILKIRRSSQDKQRLLSVSHAFSRKAIRYDMERQEHLVVALGAECDQLDEEIETLSARLHGMVDRIFPQFRKLVRKEGFDEALSNLLNGQSIQSQNPLMAALVEDVLEGATGGKGILDSIKQLHDVVCRKRELLAKLEEHLEKRMRGLAPNLRCILGDRLGVRMIQRAGSVSNLALLPASTFQLLGAEKSLFRSLKMRRSTPKYGLLYDLEYLRKDKGRMARFIASKCTIAARIDAYSEDRTDAFGKELRKMIERKMHTKPQPNRPPERTGDLLARVQRKLKETAKPLAPIQCKESYEKQKSAPEAPVPRDCIATPPKQDRQEKQKPSRSDRLQSSDKENKPASNGKESGSVGVQKPRKRFYEATESSKKRIGRPDDSRTRK